jgi:hypothetical protein
MLSNIIQQRLYEKSQQQNAFRKDVAQFFDMAYVKSFGHSPRSNTLISWRELYEFASQENEPLNYNNTTTNSDLVNYAVNKKAKICSAWNDDSPEDVQRILIDEMQKKGITKTVKAIIFLRDLDNDWLLICDGCGTTNKPSWETCRKCELNNDKK